jgi:hypothetical protein
MHCCLAKLFHVPRFRYKTSDFTTVENERQYITVTKLRQYVDDLLPTASNSSITPNELT